MEININGILVNVKCCQEHSFVIAVRLLKSGNAIVICPFCGNKKKLTKIINTEKK